MSTEGNQPSLVPLVGRRNKVIASRPERTNRVRFATEVTVHLFDLEDHSQPSDGEHTKEHEESDDPPKTALSAPIQIMMEQPQIQFQRIGNGVDSTVETEELETPSRSGVVVEDNLLIKIPQSLKENPEQARFRDRPRDESGDLRGQIEKGKGAKHSAQPDEGNGCRGLGSGRLCEDVRPEDEGHKRKWSGSMTGQEGTGESSVSFVLVLRVGILLTQLKKPVSA